MKKILTMVLAIMMGCMVASTAFASYPTCSGDKDDISVVPLPASAWLFGSGLVGLVGFARRRSRD